MRKILVTGANGFVGYYFSRMLLENRFLVVATGKGPCRVRADHPFFEYHCLDFTNETETKKVLDFHKPDAVVHCGAISNVDDCEINKDMADKVNVEGTINLLNVCTRGNIYFMFLSTDFVFDGKKGMYREDDETGPVNYYGHTKLMAEEEVKKYSYEWSIVRTILVYGKPVASRENILTNIAKGLREGRSMNIYSDQVRTPTFIKDLTAGMMQLIEKKSHGIFHLSGSDILTPYGMAVAVACHLALDATLIREVTEKDFHQPAKRPLITGFDLTRARTEINYQPVSFQCGLQQTFEV